MLPNTHKLPDTFWMVLANYDGVNGLEGWGGGDPAMSKDAAYDRFVDTAPEQPTRCLQFDCVDGLVRNVTDVTDEMEELAQGICLERDLPEFEAA